MPIDEQMGFHERIRLLYVACTRARTTSSCRCTARRARSAPELDKRTNAELLVDGMGELLDDAARRRRRAARPVPTVAAGAADAARRRSTSGQAERDAALGRVARPSADRGDRAHRRGRGRRRRRAGRRPAEAAARPRPAAVAEGPLRHRGRAGGARRAADDRPRHRRRARRRGRRAVRGRGDPRPGRRRCAGSSRDALGRRRSSRRRPPRRTGARSTPARPVGGRLLEGYVDLLYRDADGLVVVDYKTAGTNDPAQLDGRVEGYRLQGASYAISSPGPPANRSCGSRSSSSPRAARWRSTWRTSRTCRRRWSGWSRRARTGSWPDRSTIAIRGQCFARVTLTDRQRACFAAHPGRSPLLVIDLDVVRRRYEDLVDALPGVTVFYAVKANPLPDARAARRARLGVRRRQPGEIDGAWRPARRRDISATATRSRSARDIAYATHSGCRRFTFDATSELDKLVEAAPGSTVCCRSSATAPAPTGRSRASSAARRPGRRPPAPGRATGSGVGISFHVGSQQRDLDSLGRDARRGRGRPRRAARRRRSTPALLNLGGGFPGTYRRGGCRRSPPTARRHAPRCDAGSARRAASHDRARPLPRRRRRRAAQRGRARVAPRRRRRAALGVPRLRQVPRLSPRRWTRRSATACAPPARRRGRPGRWRSPARPATPPTSSTRSRLRAAARPRAGDRLVLSRPAPTRRPTARSASTASRPLDVEVLR